MLHNVCIYFLLPKVHKDFNGVEDRPVLSNCATFTEHIWEYVDHHINRLVQHVKSYIKDTNNFLLKLEEIGSIPEGASLRNMDVVGHYSSMPHGEG